MEAAPPPKSHLGGSFVVLGGSEMVMCLGGGGGGKAWVRACPIWSGLYFCGGSGACYGFIS